MLSFSYLFYSEAVIMDAFDQVNLKVQPSGGLNMTGNMMRRIFGDHSELFSEVTGIPLVVIQNTWTLYQAGASRHPIDPDAFANLANETLRLYREAIPWYPVNVSFHRMQRHWPEIMRLLPPTISIGMLSEVEKLIHHV